MTQPRHILIVDDDADLRGALVEQLALHPEFQVRAVADGRAGLAAVAEAAPDIVIMDVGLPDMDGREVSPAFAPGWLSPPDHHADRP